MHFSFFFGTSWTNCSFASSFPALEMVSGEGYEPSECTPLSIWEAAHFEMILNGPILTVQHMLHFLLFFANSFAKKNN